MPYIPDINGTGALNTISQYTQEISGTAGKVNGEIIKFPGNAAQSVGNNGTSFFSGLKNITTAAGTTVATVGGLTVPTGLAAIAGATAMALGGVVGANWYENNPELWNEVGERLYNLNPELADNVYNGATAVWTWMEDGKVYVDKDVVKTIADVFVENEVLKDRDPSYTPPQSESVVTSYLSTSALVSLLKMMRPDVANIIDGAYSFMRSLPQYSEAISEGYSETIGGHITLTYDDYYAGGYYYNIGIELTKNITYPTNPVYINDTGVISGECNGGYSNYHFNVGYVINTGEFFNNVISKGGELFWYNGSRVYVNGVDYSQLNFIDLSGIGTYTAGGYPYTGITAQEGATIMDEGDDFETVFSDWLQNAVERITDVEINPEGQFVPRTTVITIPLEVPFEFPELFPNVDPLPEPVPQPVPEPAPDPATQPEAQTGNVPWFIPALYRKIVEALNNETTKEEPDDVEDEPKEPFSDPASKDTGDTPVIVVPEGDAQALFTVYNPTQGQLNTFGGWLWSSNFLDNLIKIIENPIDCIISLKKIFCTPATSGSGTIYCGHLASSASAALVSAQYKEVDLGSIDIGEYFYDATDYPPYTSVSCFLPFIGVVELSAYDCINATMQIKYIIDCYNGDFMANVILSKENYEAITYTFSGNCSVEYPITGSNHAALAVSAAVTGITAVASGGLSLAGMAGMAGSLGGQQSINGQMSGNAGACGGKTPYVIIKRTIPKAAANFSQYRGYGASKLMNIGQCSGYTRMKAVITNNITGANDSELQEIEETLLNGIIV